MGAKTRCLVWRSRASNTGEVNLEQGDFLPDNTIGDQTVRENRARLLQEERKSPTGT